MGTLWIHIGHDKTGSSYLQALLARNRAMLRREGYFLPGDENELRRAADGHVNSGNGRITGRAGWAEEVRAARDGADVILSFEGFFNHLERKPFEAVRAWTSWARQLGLDDVKLLLFIRDPVGHAASAYQQCVKTGWTTEGPEAYFATYDRPRQVLRAFQIIEKTAGIELSLYNYSRSRGQLKAILSAWLGLETAAWDDLPSLQVNRSLSEAELKLLLRVNKVAPRLSIAIANAFSDGLPDHPSGTSVPPLEVQQEMLVRVAPSMEKVNSALSDVTQHYRADPREAGPDGASGRLGFGHVRALLAGLVSGAQSYLRQKVRRAG